MKVTRIVVPIDFSADSQAALEWAVDLTSTFGPPIDLIHVVENPMAAGVWSSPMYRIELEGVSIAYIPDHQQPIDDHLAIADGVLDLCDGVDLLIHDAQYTPDEFALKAHWGHCTVDYALHVGREAGVKRLALFHHDPTHHDAAVDSILEHARRLAEHTRVGEVVAAYEGLVISHA